MNLLLKHLVIVAEKKAEKGFTLLEYCAGAVVLLTIVYVAMRGMGTNLADFMTAIGEWSTKRGSEIRALP